MASLYQNICLIGTALATAINGRKVGSDAFGNVYYEQRRAPKTGRAKRWVIYKGPRDASTVPPEWHGWLHYTFDAPLATDSVYHKPWQQPHQPNLTATDQAYRPPGAQAANGGGQRAKATGDYQAWQPNS